jgi:hypothetical protein
MEINTNYRPGRFTTHKVASIKKGKAVPSQAWIGPEGSRNLRFPDFMTTAQDGSRVVSLTNWQHIPQEIVVVLISLCFMQGKK